MCLQSSRNIQGFTTTLFLHSDCSRCRWHTHLMNHGYFDNRKNPNTHNWAPCQDQNVSMVYFDIKMAQVLRSQMYICGTFWYLCIFWKQENPNTPNWAPCQDENGAVQGSPMYICGPPWVMPLNTSATITIILHIPW